MHGEERNPAYEAARQAAAAQRDAVATRDSGDANRASVLGGDRAAAAREVFGGGLDHLTDDDRRLIQAATGEVISEGQEPHQRPVSAFAMQLAVDRRTGSLAPEAVVDEDYLLATRDRLSDLGAPTNPFTGPTLDRALAHVRERAGVKRIPRLD